MQWQYLCENRGNESLGIARIRIFCSMEMFETRLMTTIHKIYVTIQVYFLSLVA